jgi:hypothetical protein
MRLSAELRERATAHVERLGRRRGIEVVFHARHNWHGSAWSNGELRRTSGPHIVSPLDYLVHLHELGHIATRRKAEVGVDAAVADEGAAWAWAAAQADPVIMKRMSAAEWQLVGKFFTSYVQHTATR